MIYRNRSRRPLLRIAALALGLATLVNTVAAEEWVYTVRPGDSLWKISNEYLKDAEYWPKVQKLNNIEKVKQLPPGTRLRIPVEWLKQQPSNATVVTSRGSISLIREGKSGPLPSDNSLRSGDTIRTGKNSSISIEFADGSRVLILPESEIVLETLEAQSDKGIATTAIKLINGRVENSVKPQPKGGRYQINTPAAVAAVRGTIYRVAADNNGEVMRSEVLEGKVGVTGSGVTQNVSAGYATIAKVGSPPIAPRQLPTAPDLSGLAKRTAQESISFSWPEVPSAVNYRAQLALNAEFSRMVSEQRLETPSVTWTQLSPNSYYMRVRAIDDLDLEGFNSQHAFMVDEPLRAPQAITPRDSAVTNKSQPFIAWSNVSGANFYLLQLASDESFSQDLQEIGSLINNNFKPHEPLPPGQYFWRVQSVDRSGSKSAFSAARNFTIETANP